ncbi:hypothetical protein BH09VER1_BH09VER1_56530 [soil metagenome]
METDSIPDGSVRIRKIHIDYEGGDGMPKPMTLAFSAGSDEDRHQSEQRARSIFTEQFPEWRLRGCQATEETQVIELSSLTAIAGVEGVWLFA